MTVHVPQQPPLVHIGCMCVGDEFTLTETSQVFDLYICNGTGWGLPHKLWMVELESKGAKGTIVLDTNYNQFHILSVNPNALENMVCQGMPLPTGVKIELHAEGVIGQVIAARVYLQVGGGLV